MSKSALEGEEGAAEASGQGPLPTCLHPRQPEAPEQTFPIETPKLQKPKKEG